MLWRQTIIRLTRNIIPIYQIPRTVYSLFSVFAFQMQNHHKLLAYHSLSHSLYWIHRTGIQLCNDIYLMKGLSFSPSCYSGHWCFCTLYRVKFWYIIQFTHYDWKQPEDDKNVNDRLTEWYVFNIILVWCNNWKIFSIKSGIVTGNQLQRQLVFQSCITKFIY